METSALVGQIEVGNPDVLFQFKLLIVNVASRIEHLAKFAQKAELCGEG